MDLIESIKQSVILGNQNDTEDAVKKALERNKSCDTILNNSLIPAMDEVSELFEQGEIYVPEMLIAARAMQSGLNILKPMLIERGVEPIGTIVLGTVQGDLHDLGKNLVGIMLEGAGFEVIDLGTDVYPDSFVEAARDDVDLIGLSALLTTTMGTMKRVIEALDQAGLMEKVRVIIGGAPVTQEYADEIGADGYAKDAPNAVALSKGLMGG